MLRLGARARELAPRSCGARNNAMPDRPFPSRPAGCKLLLVSDVRRPTLSAPLLIAIAIVLVTAGLTALFAMAPELARAIEVLWL